MARWLRQRDLVWRSQKSGSVWPFQSRLWWHCVLTASHLNEVTRVKQISWYLLTLRKNFVILIKFRHLCGKTLVDLISTMFATQHKNSWKNNFVARKWTKTGHFFERIAYDLRFFERRCTGIRMTALSSKVPRIPTSSRDIELCQTLLQPRLLNKILLRIKTKKTIQKKILYEIKNQITSIWRSLSISKKTWANQKNTQINMHTYTYIHLQNTPFFIWDLKFWRC